MARKLSLRFNKKDFLSGILRKVVMNRSASLYLALLICTFTTSVLAEPLLAASNYLDHQVSSSDTLDGLNIQHNLN